MTKTGKKRRKSLRRKLTNVTVTNYFFLGTFIMLTVTFLFFYNVVLSRYRDNVDMARTMKDVLTAHIDISELVDAVLLQERTDPENFRKTMFATEAADNEGQLLSYQWFTEEDPPLGKREDYQYVTNVLYAFNKNNQNLNGTSLMVFDKKTHIAALLCDVEKFGSDTPTVTDYVMWRNFQEEDLLHIEEERWSLAKNLYRYMRVDPRYMVFIWYEPVPYPDEDVVVFVESDVFYTRLLGGVLSFIVAFMIFIFLLVMVMGRLYHHRMTRMIIQPINAISGAAKSYVDDHVAGTKGKSHFDGLCRDSSDEFEELAKTMNDMERDIDRFEADLTRATAERERLSAELHVANRIQADMLPKDFPLFPDRKEFDLFASMTPAKEVGGDFYDVFFLDEDHLCIVMADVAGKGIPAALFMVNSMNNIRSRAAAGGTPSEILFDVNNALCKGNKEKIFVTVWLAIVTMSTGEVVETNAGHENPLLREGEGDFSYIERKHGFVLGGRKNMKYRDDTFTLSPGDTIFIYTDGVTEATNEAGERFYNDRLLAALNEVKGGTAREIADHVKERVDGFVAGADQFDDLTMLAFVYQGEQVSLPGSCNQDDREKE